MKVLFLKYVSLLVATGWMFGVLGVINDTGISADTKPLVAAIQQNPNQTPDVSPIFPALTLPFHVHLEVADFSLPNGLQTYVLGTYKGKWLLLCGRTNGLHGFNNDPNNFPPSQQNSTVYVVDPQRKSVFSRSLTDLQSGLTLDQIESLSVTAAQAYQSGNTLYIAGGYGFRSAISNFTTFDRLTAIDIPGLMNWVIRSNCHPLASQFIRQISNPLVRVTGGYMDQIGKNPTLLIFGQDFEGTYFFGNPIQIYTRQVRRFNIIDDGKNLDIQALPSHPLILDPNFRRRDLNVVRVVRSHHQKCVTSLMAYAGVFTPNTGVWTVPVKINARGYPKMPDPTNPRTFKQGMNNYNCATLGLFSKKNKEMYTLFFGGISYEFFENGAFQTDLNFPFINQVTTIKIDKKGQITQYLMEDEYPVILSTQSNPGNRLLFGAEAQFIPIRKIAQVTQNVIELDKLEKPTLIGYIVGGIQSTLPNTNTMSDSSASSYVFKVIIDPIRDKNSSD